ncbi:MAG: murein L,D-transpeptidase YcbB/YkuD [Myxococcota bacterium]|jgi:murein L,D-transpeptidase YcbB/YkuD
MKMPRIMAFVVLALALAAMAPAVQAADHLSPNARKAAQRWLAEARLYGVDVAALADHGDEALVTAVAGLAAALPARPNPNNVLEDAETGLYLSPDVLWQESKREPALLGTIHAAVLAAVAVDRLGGYLADQLPTHPQFRALVDAARRYSALCEAGGWAPVVVIRGRKGSAWKDTAELTKVQARLAMEGFYSGEPNGIYDDATRDAMKRYRRARVMRGKAYYDPDVAEALNVPCEARLATILLNIRRWRHTAQTDETTHVRVNLAGADVHYTRDGVLKSTHRAVVGSNKPVWVRRFGKKVLRNATPVMHDHISTIVVNPLWTVPKRLVRDELKPAIAKDPDYLAKHGYIIRTAANGAQMYVQSHGPHNALGQVKITFPNSERIYLHDTNKRGFFRYPKRAFSHGCVRVKNAFELGSALVKDDFEARGVRFSIRSMKKRVERNDKTYFYGLETQVPIFMEYYTATAETDGTVSFHPDSYGYDAAALETR